MSALPALFMHELRTLVRAPVLWLITALLGITLITGAFNTSARHREQTAAIAQMAQSETAWHAELEQRVARYAQPSEQPLPYWQDPTDVAGFSSYFLRAHAAKPHLLTSVLSIGQSDLLPFLMPLSLDTPFGVEPAYDFEAPRSLALGVFDVGFVIVYLLPLSIILLVTLLGAYERDHGLLRLVAAQSTTPRRFLAVRLIALGVLFVPLVVTLITIALLLASPALTAAVPEFISALALITGYAMFWLGTGFLVLTLHRGAVATAGLLMGVWLFLTLGIPLATNLIINIVAPAPSRVLYIDTLRQVDDALTAERPVLLANWLAANGRAADAPQPTYAAEMTIIAPERERRLASQHAEKDRHQETLASWTAIVNTLSPPVAMQQALAMLAGTDNARHTAFLEAVRTYQQTLRDFFYPLVQREILQARPVSCAECAGKLQFMDFASIPRFTFEDISAVERSRRAWHTWFQCILYGLFMIAAGCLRARAWKARDLG